MRKKNKLYTANKYNQTLFARGVDREHQNVFDGLGASSLDIPLSNGYGSMSGMGWYQTPQISKLTVSQPINWGNSVQANNSVANSQQLVNNFHNNTSQYIPQKGSSSESSDDSDKSRKSKWASYGAAAASAIDVLNNSTTSDEFQRGFWDYGEPMYYLTNNNHSKIGDAASDVGVELTKQGLSSGNPWIMLGGAAFKVHGDIYNAAFGHKENEKTEATVEANNKYVSNLANVIGRASSNEDLLTMASNVGNKAKISDEGFGNGWFNNDGTDAYNKMSDSQDDAYNIYANSLYRAAQNVDKSNDDLIMRNFAAYGGPLDMVGSNNGSGAIDYGFMSDYLTAKNKATANKNNVTTNYFSPLSTFALGGDIQANGADFSTGLSKIMAGGSHEESPYDGVQVGISQENGQPNLVEEGETIFDDYVYSRRIMMDAEAKKKFHVSKKTEISYADESKKLEKEAAERPNDAISQRALTKQMHELAEEQERQKSEMQAQEAQDAFNSLPPEQQREIMQEVAMQEQQGQQNQTAEQLGTEQPVESAEAMPMDEQQMAMEPNGEASGTGAEEISAMGGKINRFDYGGALNWLRKNHPEYKGRDLQTMAAFIDKMSKKHDAGNLTNGSKAVHNDVYYSNIYDEYRPTVNLSDDNVRKYYNQAVANGFSPELAFMYTAPKQYRTGASNGFTSSKGFRKYSDYKQAIMGSSASTGSKGVRSLSGKVFATHRQAQQDNYEYKNKIGKYAPTAKTETKVPATEIAAETPKAESTKTSTAQKPVVAKDIEQTAPTVSKHSGSWKDATEDHWGTYTKPGLEKFFDDIEARVNIAPDDETRNAILKEGADAFMNIQKGYSQIYDPDISGSHNYDEAVQAHQNAFNNVNGNVGFYSKDDKGNFTNLVSEAINLPNGANTEDNVESWRDGYWGPRTSIRNFGSTEYGDDKYYEEIANRAKKLGYTFAPGDYTYSNGDKTYNLYSLSVDQPTVNAGEDINPWAKYANTTPATNTTTPTVATSATTPVTTDGENGIAPVLKNENLRYTGLMGPAVGLGMMAAGVGKPDYSRLDAALNTVNQAPVLARQERISNYMRYNPMDIWSEQNRNDATSAGTDRAISNSSSPIGTKEAALVANGYNTMLTNGALYRKAKEYNDALNAQVQEFNRGTDQFNASGFNQMSATNAQILNANRQQRAQMAMEDALQRMNADASWYNSLYGNVNNLFKGISNLGKENAQHNMIARMAADGLFGNMSDNQYIGNGYVTRASKGGRISKKKKKGLTV